MDRALSSRLQREACRRASQPTPTQGIHYRPGAPACPASRGDSVQGHLFPWGVGEVGQVVTQRAGSGLKDGILGVWENCPHPSSSQPESQFEILL